MNMQAHGHIARAAVTAGLAAVLALGGVAVPVTSALADTTPGNITITATAGNEGMTYDVYRIFTGDVTGDDDQISNLAWADAATHEAVVGAIRRHDADYADPDDAAESAQAAAEYISKHIGDADGTTGGSFPSRSTGEGTWTAAGSFGDDLSDAVDALTKAGTVSAGETASFADGYYLLVSDTASVDGDTRTDQTGTSPIFCVIGGHDVTVTEKTTTVTVEKVIKEDSDADQAWGKASDANRSQDVLYQLSCTLPGNLASYSRFYLEFHDTITTGIDVDTDSVRVYAAPSADKKDDTSSRVDVTSAFTVTDKAPEDGSTTHELSVAVTDGNILGIKTGKVGDADTAVSITKDTVFVVEYTATLNATSTIGAKGNPNEVYVEYTKNPNHEGSSSGYGDSDDEHGTTHTDDVKAYTYELQLHKQDKQNSERALEGAHFTIQVAEGNSDSGSVGKYLQEDGSLGADKHEFVTDKGGDISVPRVDEGTYTVTEVQAPDAGTDEYQLVPAFTVTIGSNVSTMAAQKPANQSLVLTSDVSVPVSVTGSYDAVVADSVDDSGTAHGNGVNADAGTVHLVVRDTRNVLMPLTGLSGNGALLAAGVAIVAVGTTGVVIAVRRRGRGKGQGA